MGLGGASGHLHQLTLYPPTVRLILQGLSSSSCLLFISSTSIGGASVTLENSETMTVGFCLVLPGVSVSLLVLPRLLQLQTSPETPDKPFSLHSARDITIN